MKRMGWQNQNSNFRALIDCLARVGVVFEEKDKTNALLSSLLDL